MGKIPPKARWFWVAALLFLGFFYLSSTKVSAVDLSVVIPGGVLSASNISSTPLANPEPSYHLVVASLRDQNVTWLSQIPTKWAIKRYILDDPLPQNELPIDPDRPPREEILPVPRQQGREAMAYLSYIIDNYDDLPGYALFVHGHVMAWHQVMPIYMLVRALNLTALDNEQYISLQCSDIYGCENVPAIDTWNPRFSRAGKICAFWELIRPGHPCPRYLSSKCCAQFAVTREAIRTLTLDEWIQIREPLLHDYTIYPGISDLALDEWDIGWIYEKTWHIFFGMPDQHCPSISHCKKVYFSNAIACDGNTDNMEPREAVWGDIKCVSAFDHLGKDEPGQKSIGDFAAHMEDTMKGLSVEAGNRRVKLLEAARTNLL